MNESTYEIMSYYGMEFLCVIAISSCDTEPRNKKDDKADPKGSIWSKHDSAEGVATD